MRATHALVGIHRGHVAVGAVVADHAAFSFEVEHGVHGVQWVRTGHVQAQENPLTNFLGFELWRDHPHVSLSSHFWGVLLLLCPMEWYQRLPNSAREHLASSAQQATRLQRELAAQEDARALARLTELDVQIVKPQDMDIAAFRSKVAPVRKQVETHLPTELVQAYTGWSTAYSSPS